MIVFPSATFLGSTFQIVTICWVTLFFLLSLSWCLRVLDRLMGMHGMEGYELYADGGYLYHVWQRHCRLKGWFLCWFIKLLDFIFNLLLLVLDIWDRGTGFFTNYPIYTFLISMCIYQTTLSASLVARKANPTYPVSSQNWRIPFQVTSWWISSPPSHVLTMWQTKHHIIFQTLRSLLEFPHVASHIRKIDLSCHSFNLERVPKYVTMHFIWI